MTATARDPFNVADSRLWLAGLEPQSVALAVFSPPYFDKVDYGVPGQIGFGQTWEDYLQALRDLLAGVQRALVPGGRACVVVGDLTDRPAQRTGERVSGLRPLSDHVTARALDLGFQFTARIAWPKLYLPPRARHQLGSYPYPPHPYCPPEAQYVLVFRQPGRRTRPGEVPPEIRERSRLTREDWFTYTRSVWLLGPGPRVDHPAPFPVELPLRCIRLFTFADEGVIDPCCGAGATAVAALRTGRRFRGCDLNPDYIAQARARLAREAETLNPSTLP